MSKSTKQELQEINEDLDRLFIDLCRMFKIDKLADWINERLKK
jgi:hypothetical protein